MTSFNSGFDEITREDLEEFSRNVEDAAARLKDLEGATRSASSATNDIASSIRQSGFADFVRNTALRHGRRAALRAGATAISGVLEGKDLADAIGKGVVDALAQAPFVGSLFKDVTEPKDNALARTLAITGAISRAGGKVDSDMRQRLFDRFFAQEIRATRERRALVTQLDTNEALSVSFSGSRLEQLMFWAADQINGVKNFILGR